MPQLASILSRLIEIYMIVVLINVLLSWVVFSTQNQTIRRIYVLTGQLVDPTLQPIRRVCKPLSQNIGIDFSPIILLFFLHFLNSMLLR